MKLHHFIAGGLAFWVGELAEHFAGGLIMGLVVAGVTGAVALYVGDKIAARIK